MKDVKHVDVATRALVVNNSARFGTIMGKGYTVKYKFGNYIFNGVLVKYIHRRVCMSMIRAMMLVFVYEYFIIFYHVCVSIHTTKTTTIISR